MGAHVEIGHRAPAYCPTPSVPQEPSPGQALTRISDALHFNLGRRLFPGNSRLCSDKLSPSLLHVLLALVPFIPASERCSGYWPIALQRTGTIEPRCVERRARIARCKDG